MPIIIINRKAVLAAPIPPSPDSYRDLILTDTPLAYWKLDETSGVIADDYIGSNDGTLFGSYVLGQTPLTTYNTSAIVGNFPTAGYLTTPDVLNTAGSFSIEFWIKPSVLGPTDGVVQTLFEQGAANQFSMVWDKNFGGGVNRLRMLSNGASVLTSTTGSVIENNTYHIVLTYDTVLNDMFLYINGVLNVSNTAVSPDPPNVLTPLYFGARASNGFDLPFFGGLDEIAVYNYVLTQQQIAEHAIMGGVNIINTPSLDILGVEVIQQNASNNNIDLDILGVEVIQQNASNNNIDLDILGVEVIQQLPPGTYI